MHFLWNGNYRFDLIGSQQSYNNPSEAQCCLKKKNGSSFFGRVTSQSLIFVFFHPCRLGLTSSVLKQFLLFTNGSKIRMKQVWWNSFKLNEYIGSRLLTGPKFSRVLLDGAYSWGVDHLKIPIAILHREWDWCGYTQLCLPSPICCHYM